MPIGQYMIDTAHTHAMKVLKRKWAEHTICFPMRYYDEHPSAQLLQGSSADMECVSVIVHEDLEQMIRKIVGGAAGLMIMFCLQPWFSLVVLCFGFVSIKITQYCAARIEKESQSLLGQKDMMDMLFEEFPQIYSRFRRNLAGMNRVVDVLEEAEEKEADWLFQDEKSTDVIRLDHVSFAYNGSEWVLDDLSLRVPSQGITLIEGESGCGKSTLIRLLLGDYKANEGVIYRNAERVGYVPQVPYLFSDTIYENLACVGEGMDKEILWKALKEAQADTFVRNLENGIHTQLLDEPSSALDGETSRQLAQTLAGIAKKIPIVIVTNDRSLELIADQIIVL